MADTSSGSSRLICGGTTRHILDLETGLVDNREEGSEEF